VKTNLLTIIYKIKALEHTGQRMRLWTVSCSARQRHHRDDEQCQPSLSAYRHFSQPDHSHAPVNQSSNHAINLPTLHNITDQDQKQYTAAINQHMNKPTECICRARPRSTQPSIPLG